MIYVLGIDPGTVTGWAFIKAAPGKVTVLAHGVVQKDHGLESSAVIIRCAQMVPERPWLAVEGQFIPERAGIYEGRRAQAIDALKTALHAGGWLYLAQSLRWDVYHHDRNIIGIPPQVWRRAVYGTRAIKGFKAPEYKAHALAMAKTFYGVTVKKTHHHAAEALMIAGYAAGEILNNHLLHAAR